MTCLAVCARHQDAAGLSWYLGGMTVPQLPPRVPARLTTLQKLQTVQLLLLMHSLIQPRRPVRLDVLMWLRFPRLSSTTVAT